MNQQRFIADFKKLYASTDPEELPHLVAEYVDKHFFERLATDLRGSRQPGEVINECCRYFGVSFQHMRRQDRKERIRVKRQVTTYMLLRFTKLQAPAVSRLFGQDRTTAYHSVERVEELIETDQGVREDVEQLVGLLTAKGVDEGDGGNESLAKIEEKAN